MAHSYGIPRSTIPDFAAFEAEVKKQQHERQYLEEEQGTLLDVLARKDVMKTEYYQSVLRALEGYTFGAALYLELKLRI